MLIGISFRITSGGADQLSAIRKTRATIDFSGNFHNQTVLAAATRLPRIVAPSWLRTGRGPASPHQPAPNPGTGL